MTAPTQTVENNIFTNLCKEHTMRSMNLTNLVPLNGQVNYNSWASTMSAIWRSMRLNELIVKGINSSNVESEEQNSCRVSYSHAVAAYI